MGNTVSSWPARDTPKGSFSKVSEGFPALDRSQDAVSGKTGEKDQHI